MILIFLRERSLSQEVTSCRLKYRQKIPISKTGSVPNRAMLDFKLESPAGRLIHMAFFVGLIAEL